MGDASPDGTGYHRQNTSLAMRNKPPLNLALVASLLALALPAKGADNQQPVLSVNFTKEAKLEPAETAGVIPAANWNDAPDKQGWITQLIDNRGEKTEASIHWSGGLPPWTNVEVTETSGNAKMMKGYLDCNESTPTTIALAGLEKVFGGKPYDLIIYTDGQNGGATRASSFTIGAKTLFATDPGKTSFKDSFDECIEAEYESVPAPGNYVRFHQLTDDTVNLEVRPGPSQDPWPRGVICGIQIVPSESR